MKNRKGRMTIDEAPGIVLIVGLVFLVLATFAFVGEKYGNSVLTDTTATVTNETGAWINSTTYTVDNSGALNFASLTITALYNATDDTAIGLGNVTVSGSGFTNATATNWDDVIVSYTYIYNQETSAYNATADMQTEISNNTSITGIILTISLVGIILTLLIGVFLGISRRTRI